MKPSTPQQILKQRARELARPRHANLRTGPSLEVIEFRLAHERYAVEHALVREVVLLKELTPLPCTPPFIAGIMNLRSQFIPLLNIKRFFDLPETGITDLHVVIIVHLNDMELGILADAVAEVHSISLDSIQPGLPTLTEIRSRYLKGIARQNLVILDVAKILHDPKIVIDEQVQS